MSEYDDPTLTEELPEEQAPEDHFGPESDPGTEPHTIIERYPDGSYSTVTDHDGDGFADLVQQDIDGDGNTDLAYVDSNLDGTLDSVIADRDDDGTPDLLLADRNADGLIDFEAHDLNEDGAIDHVVVDQNFDGRPDVWVDDTNFDGHPDQLRHRPLRRHGHEPVRPQLIRPHRPAQRHRSPVRWRCAPFPDRR
jgi:hypothetical protein